MAVKAFILASVAAVMPVPQYARDLSDGEYIVWLARLLWVLMLTFGVGVVLLLLTLVLLLFGVLAKALRPVPYLLMALFVLMRLVQLLPVASITQRMLRGSSIT